MKKRLLSFFLALIMVMSLVPAYAFAEEDETDTQPQETIEATETPAAEHTQTPAEATPTAEPTAEPTEAPATNAVEEAVSEEQTISLAALSSTYVAAFDESLLNGIPVTADAGSGTTGWGVRNGYLCSGNSGRSYSSSTLTLTLTSDALISFEYKVSTEAKYDKVTISHNSTVLVDAVSGEIDWTALQVDAKKGDTITVTYKKDGSGDAGDDCVYLRNFAAGDPILVSFDANGGTGEMDTQKVYGSTALKQNAFTKDHAVFIGWAETADGEVKYTDGQQIDKPESDITLYAVWADACVITFTDANTSVNVKTGDAISADKIPEVSKKGYKLAGWYCDGVQLDASAAVTKDASYTASWTPISYTVRFDANGGTGIMDELSLSYDQKVSLPKSIFARSGYKFAGWSNGVSHYADEEEVCNLTATDGDVLTFKAEWTGNSVAVTVDLNYETEGRITSRVGVVGSNYNYVLNETSGKASYSELKDPTRDGYKFAGWFSAATGGEEITNQYKFTADDSTNGITLYAHWVEAVTVTYDANGGKCYTTSKTIAKGSTLGYLPSATLSNKAFEGWYTAAEGGDKIETTTPINESMTLYAHYRSYNYKIRFNAKSGEGSMDDVTVDFGVDYTLPECTFTREDYIFQGWSTSSWSSTVKYEDGAVINREYDSWYNDDGETFSLYAVWKETTFGAAFKAIENKLPTGNIVRSTGSLGLPESGTGWTVSYSGSDDGYISGGEILAVPESGSKTVTLTATVTETATGETKSREYTLVIYSDEAVAAESTLKKALYSLPYRFEPAYDTDKNANTALEAILAGKGYDGITVSVKARAEATNKLASVEEDGSICYYFNPEMTGSGAYFYVTFVFSLNGASVEKQIYTHLTWDIDRAREALNAELDRVSVPSVVTIGTISTLPRYSVKEGADEASIDYDSNADLNTWAVMTWESSANYIKVGTAPSTPVYSPYPVTILPDEARVKVTLTATMSLNTVKDSDGNYLSASKSFEVTVKPSDEDPRDALRYELGEKLDAALKDPGLRDFTTGEKLDTGNVTGDIRFPTTRDIGIDGKYQPVTITSSDESVIKTPDVNNSARAEVYRPLPGSDPVDVTVTITITDKETEVTVSRDITVTVSPLTNEEIEAETALMEQVKAHYFDGIKNENTDPEEITTDLRPFLEASMSDGELVWAYSYDTMTGNGIVPVAMDGWEVEESWRTFKSSNAKVITHENLLVTRDTEHKRVTVTSWLSSEKYGKYAEMYPNDARFAALYNQPVSAELIVLGTNPTKDKPEDNNMRVTFALTDNGNAWYTVAYDDLLEGATAFDLFRRAMAEGGYAYAGGKFVTGVSMPGGGMLYNKSRGEYSGWMYSVNGNIPELVMTEYYLSDGDAMVFFYTDDYREILGMSKYTVQQVIDLINAIGTVDKSSGDKIVAARTAYDTLRDSDKAKVTNRSTLFAAEKKYAELIRDSAARFKDIYTSTGDYISEMDENTLCNFGGEWLIFGLARSERDLPEIYEAYYSAVEKYVSENIDDSGRLDATRATDNAKLVITLSAIDKDVTDVGGHNLLTALADMNYVKSQGLSGAIYTLLAFDCRDYEIPDAPDGKLQTTREELISFILDRQLADGGWAYSGDSAESDMTAMVLQALAAYYSENEDVKTAVDKAINRLSEIQTTTGGFTSGSSVTPESAAQVITALTALGIDPDTDSRFIKNGVSVLDSLCSFYVEGGGFSHAMSGELNELATAQSYYALCAYWRFTQNKTALYDITDLDAAAEAA